MGNSLWITYHQRDIVTGAIRSGCADPMCGWVDRADGELGEWACQSDCVGEFFKITLVVSKPVV